MHHVYAPRLVNMKGGYYIGGNGPIWVKWALTNFEPVNKERGSTFTHLQTNINSMWLVFNRRSVNQLNKLPRVYNANFQCPPIPLTPGWLNGFFNHTPHQWITSIGYKRTGIQILPFRTALFSSIPSLALHYSHHNDKTTRPYNRTTLNLIDNSD